MVEGGRRFTGQRGREKQERKSAARCHRHWTLALRWGPPRRIKRGTRVHRSGSVAAGGASPADDARRPVSGTVAHVNHQLRIFQLGSKTFHVPSAVEGLYELAPGVSVLVRYERVEGRSVVWELEIPEPD